MAKSSDIGFPPGDRYPPAGGASERHTAGKASAKAEREKRLAEALRANLRRRKAAARDRAPTDDAGLSNPNSEATDPFSQRKPQPKK